MPDPKKEPKDDTKPDAGRKVPLFIAVGHEGQRVSSENGSDWKNSRLGKEGEVYRAISFGNGSYVAVGTFGGQNIFASSTDGLAWQTDHKDGQYKTYIRGLGFGNGMFLAVGGDPGSVGSSTPVVLTSADGIKWTDYINIKGKNILRRIAYGGNMFVGVGDRGRRAVSKNGTEWTDAPDVKAMDTLIDVAFGKGVFVGVGLNGLRMSSEDGLKWANRQVGEEGEHLNSILWAGDRFVAVGLGATFTSPDGVNWKRSDNKDAPLFATYGNGVFVGAHWRGRILRSTDAIEWKQVYKSGPHIEAIGYG